MFYIKSDLGGVNSTFLGNNVEFNVEKNVTPLIDRLFLVPDWSRIGPGLVPGWCWISPGFVPERSWIGPRTVPD